jgi:hypothetical protein
MTQIVRKFILFSIILTFFTILIAFIFQKLFITEPFGIRDINGRRNKAFRKCIANSTSNIINQNQECNLEAFQNVLTNNIVDSLNIANTPLNKNLSNIINQINNWSMNNDAIDNIFDVPIIDIQYKTVDIDTNHIKFNTKLPLSRYQKDLKKALENDLSRLSRQYNNMNTQEKDNFKEILLKHAYIAFKVNVKDNSVLILPKQVFNSDDITLPIGDNNDLLVHINVNNQNTNNKKYELHSITIEKIKNDIDIKFADISLDIGLFNLGNNNKFVSFKNIKIID